MLFSSLNSWMLCKRIKWLIRKFITRNRSVRCLDRYSRWYPEEMRLQLGNVDRCFIRRFRPVVVLETCFLFTFMREVHLFVEQLYWQLNTESWNKVSMYSFSILNKFHPFHLQCAQTSKSYYFKNEIIQTKPHQFVRCALSCIFVVEVKSVFRTCIVYSTFFSS